MSLIAGVTIALAAATGLADEPPTVSLQSAPPVVVSTLPAAGSNDVDPGLGTIRVTFSKPMRDGSWSWVQMSKDSFPTMRGKPRYLKDGRTNVLDVTLHPNQTYAIWLNSDKFRNFVDREGRAAVPYLLVFRTGDATAEAPALDATTGRETSNIRFLTEGETTIVDVTSPSGIDRATIGRKSDQWPKSMRVRLHLGGLESFQAAGKEATIAWSVSGTGDHRSSVSLRKGKEATALDATSPYHTQLRIVGGNGKIPLQGGYFEVPLPSKLFAGNPPEIALRWIDFYRN